MPIPHSSKILLDAVNMCISLPKSITLEENECSTMENIVCLIKLAHFNKDTPLKIHICSFSINSMENILFSEIPILKQEHMINEYAMIERITGYSCLQLPLPIIDITSNKNLKTSDTNEVFIGNKNTGLNDNNSQLLNIFIEKSLNERYARKHGVDLKWNDLTPTQKDQNIYQAAHHIIKFATLGYNIVRGRDDDKWSEFLSGLTDMKIMSLAKMEHNRWWAVMLANGWHVGDVRDNNAMTHPDMIPFECLDEDGIQIDIDAFENIIEVYRELEYYPEKILMQY